MTQEKQVKKPTCPACDPLKGDIRVRVNGTFRCIKCGYDSRSDK